MQANYKFLKLIFIQGDKFWWILAPPVLRANCPCVKFAITMSF